jgi:hypothetical protein
VFPLTVGCVIRGTIECYSSRKAQLLFDEEYLTAIADAIGDIAGRLESTADIAWISRLSFLHSARHELENFLTMLSARDTELHDSLRTTLQRYSGIGPAPWGPSPSATTLADQLHNQLLEAIDSPQSSESLVAEIKTIEEFFSPDHGFKFLFREVLSTLIVNAKKHSNLRASDFQFELSTAGEEMQSVQVKYMSSDKRIDPTRAERVGTSPIPDSKHDTYHYGLFLAAAQVRMNGGAVYVNTTGELALDVIPFEVCFLLPLYPLGDVDAN